MKTLNVGKSNVKASVIGLGTWAIGGTFWGGTDETDAIKTVQMAKDYGINLIDTAPIYGFGASELIIGKAIKGHRDKYVISTKCGLNWNSKQGVYLLSTDDKEVYKCLEPKFIRLEIENSLKRLKTDYVDIYYTHWQDESTPIESVVETLKQLKKEGKILAFGASNLNIEILEEYDRLDCIDTAQEEYNLLNRNLENSLLPYCRKNNISMAAYCPLAQGLLTGKITSKDSFNKGDMRKEMGSFSSANLKKVEKLSHDLKEIADSYNVSIAQLVIAWTIKQPGITHVLCGSRKPMHLKENVKAGEITLTDEESKRIIEIAEDSKAVFNMFE